MTKANPQTTEVPTKTWQIVAQFDDYDTAVSHARSELDNNFIKGIDYKIKRSRKTGRFSVRTIKPVVIKTKKGKNKKQPKD
jgi:hypothetical protein|tara:strand:- start:5359 stop:5601 length:243 start_codon:yes stop_codon:yes gene_type:complete